jgi:hypothetical protein
MGHERARPNEDGTRTYVVSLRDPEVSNWLDADGLEEGTLLIRWQQIGAAGSPGAEPSSKGANRAAQRVDRCRSPIPPRS